MTAWLIWTSGQSANLLPAEPRILTIESKRKPSFAQGDKVALLAGDHQFKSHLIGSATIMDIDVQRQFETVRTRLFLGQLRPPEHDFDLDMLLFSLEFVRNLKEPWRHFIRPYRRISSSDIDVVTTGQIFWTRTAFLTFYIPLESRQRFDVQRVSFEKTGRALETLRYYEKWAVLKEYLQDDLLAFGALFESIASIWQVLEEEPGMPQLSQLYFGAPSHSDDSRTGHPRRNAFPFDSIGKQHGRFRDLDRLFGISTGTLHQHATLFRMVDEQVRQSDSSIEARFEERFRGYDDR